MVSPSGRVLEWAPDWFFMAIEAYGGGTSDLGFFSGVSIFIKKLALETRQGGPRGSDKPVERALGGRTSHPCGCLGTFLAQL